MLPDRLRLRKSTDFVRVMRQGEKTVRRTLVMYALSGQPSVGVVVGKSVGRAVQRNRVKRRLRHMASALIDDDFNASVVVRALPPACGDGLDRDFRSAWFSLLKGSR